MDDITEKELDQLTKLSRIHITKEEKKKLLCDMQAILNHANELQAINTDDVPVCNHVIENTKNVFREDIAKDLLDTKAFLSNAPSEVGGMVRVPLVIKF
ncbi:MAG: Asp-tRNA(Asn)/Glu-tRNA(Gln) amidotransferase subunit GatC [Simkaniaceae bacterium]|nr:Asp-tRNA(Asn)/Glu-tRNA(Gln) amidotransferase subunit GatC [Simkaniaceae bacterium]